jgi:Transposase DDE domain group 1
MPRKARRAPTRARSGSIRCWLTWTSAVDADGQVRHSAEVCELTGRIDLHTWPEGTRAICRREDAHPGAQLRFTDHDGHRFQVFLTDQPDPDLAALELRHRQRARVEDRIRAAKATGLANLPFDLWRRNSVWLELVLAAQDLTCWTQALLLDGDLAVAEPKTLRYRLLHVAARIVRHARRVILRRQRSWPWAVALARRSLACTASQCAADHRAPPSSNATRAMPRYVALPASRRRAQITPRQPVLRPPGAPGLRHARTVCTTTAISKPTSPLMKSRG